MTRILLIDDDAADRMAVRRALRSLGADYEVVEASDGASGLVEARKGGFVCVLLDFRLPDVDTFELLSDLISPEGGRHAVIMLTGEADQELAARLMRAGALDYLTKGETSPSNLARSIRFAQARQAFVAELQRARDAAEEHTRALDGLNRQKTLLLSIIAHDLRNPFQALLGLSRSLSTQVEKKNPDAIERQAKGLFEAANRAHVLMEGLFSWARLQMEATILELGPVDLDPLVKLCFESVRERAAEKHVALESDCHGLKALGQQDMLAAVLRNLVSNGIKFTPPGGTVSVAAERVGDRVEISVVDNGVGMSDVQLGQLFKIEERATTPGTQGEPGGGLGLLLCQEFVELQGGKIEARSEVGKGSTFSFRLPAA